MQALLFNKNEQKTVNKMQKKIESKFAEVGGDIKVGG
jgi:DNA mismatch repair protein MutS2